MGLLMTVEEQNLSKTAKWWKGDKDVCCKSEQLIKWGITEW